MNSRFHLRHVLAVAALMAVSITQAATLSKADFKAGKDTIAAEYKASKMACANMAGNAKDICVEQAKGHEKVARAELEYGYTGKAKDATKVLVAKADADYAVAKEKCDDQTGNNKDVCVKQAKALKAKALADAKLNTKVTDAQQDAAKTKREADYKVEAEKCDAMSGDAKSSCINAAKMRLGKS